jgi:hypothetical protein
MREDGCDGNRRPELLWTPDAAATRSSAMAQFGRFLSEKRLVDVDELDYTSLHAWSVDDLDGLLVGGR